MPAFTLFVLGICEGVKNHLLISAGMVAGIAIGFLLALRTDGGRWAFDKLKLTDARAGTAGFGSRHFPVRAHARHARRSGVPILQALTIVRETAGNVILGKVISNVHDHVKEGDPIAPTLKASQVFPAMVAGIGGCRRANWRFAGDAAENCRQL